MDLHASQIQGFFDIPVDNLAGNPILDVYKRQPYRLRMVARMLVQTSPACSAVAVLPVPMAQMGS